MNRLVPQIVVSSFYEHALDEIPEVVPAVDCRWRRLTEGDMDLFAQVRPMSAAKTEQFRRRLLGGDECYGVFVGDRLVHYNWVQWQGIHSLQEEGLRARCPEKAFWLYDARTADAARGRHVYPYLQTVIMRLMRDRGFDRCLVYTGADNAASRKGMARSGFRHVRNLYAVRWLGRSFPLPRVWLRKAVVEFGPGGRRR